MYDDNRSRQSSKRKSYKKKNLPKINLELDIEAAEQQIINSGRLNLIKEAPIHAVQENINAINEFIDPLRSNRKQSDSDFQSQVIPVELKCLAQIQDLDEHLGQKMKQKKEDQLKKKKNSFLKKLGQSDRNLN